MDYAIIDFRCSDKMLGVLFDLVGATCYHYNHHLTEKNIKHYEINYLNVGTSSGNV